MVVVDDEHRVVVRIAVALFQAHGSGGLQVADERLGIVIVPEDVGELAQQRRQVHLLVLTEVLLRDFDGAAQQCVVERPERRRRGASVLGRLAAHCTRLLVIRGIVEQRIPEALAEQVARVEIHVLVHVPRRGAGVRRVDGRDEGAVAVLPDPTHERKVRSVARHDHDRVYRRRSGEKVHHVEAQLQLGRVALEAGRRYNRLHPNAMQALLNRRRGVRRKASVIGVGAAEDRRCVVAFGKIAANLTQNLFGEFFWMIVVAALFVKDGIQVVVIDKRGCLVLVGRIRIGIHHIGYLSSYSLWCDAAGRRHEMDLYVSGR